MSLLQVGDLVTKYIDDINDDNYGKTLEHKVEACLKTYKRKNMKIETMYAEDAYAGLIEFSMDNIQSTNQQKHDQFFNKLESMWGKGRPWHIEPAPVGYHPSFRVGLWLTCGDKYLCVLAYQDKLCITSLLVRLKPIYDEFAEEFSF